MPFRDDRWVLAFDGGCARCRSMSRTVRDACHGRLEIIPLSHPDVRVWAARARPGREMAHSPTLFRVRGDRVRAWTGAALAARLVRHLGARDTIRVLSALGEPTPPVVDATSQPVKEGTTRRRFLQLGAGGVLAAGILITGAVPAAADPVTDWINRNRDPLPRTYQKIAALPPEYRAAVYAELTPQERSTAWTVHLTLNRSTFTPVTAEQDAVFDGALTIAADPANFVDGQPPAPGADELSEQAITLFGLDTARAIFATLGPDTDSPAAPFAGCGCSTASDYCGGHCQGGGCTVLSSGCGFLYQYACNGHCV